VPAEAIAVIVGRARERADRIGHQASAPGERRRPGNPEPVQGGAVGFFGMKNALAAAWPTLRSRVGPKRAGKADVGFGAEGLDARTSDMHFSTTAR